MSSNDTRGNRHTSNARATGQPRQNPISADITTPHRKVNKPVQANNNSNPTQSPGPVENVPLPTFNLDEVDKLLLKGMSQQAQGYTPSQQTAPPKPGPWAVKAGAMANGRDFWLELRKQVTALRQSGGVSQGG